MIWYAMNAVQQRIAIANNGNIDVDGPTVVIVVMETAK